MSRGLGDVYKRQVYKYAFETESDEYYERFEISRELKQKCIAASNGHKYY